VASPARALSSHPDAVTVVVAVGAGAVCAVLIAVPDVAVLQYPVIAAVILVMALLIPPTAFVIGSFLFFSTLHLVAGQSYSVGPANVFLSDLFLGLVAVRALSPRERTRTTWKLGPLTLGAFAVWTLLMVAAIARGASGGAALDSVVRYASPLFYWPVLYFGFSRVLREKGIDPARVLRGIVVIGLALIGYMFLMRLLNRPFESDSTGGRLGEVIASSGETFHRDFGLWSAFIVYPIVALIGMGKLLYAKRNELAWLIVTALGIAATLATLIRSEIYGLIAGIAVLVLLSSDHLRRHGGSAVRSRFVTLLMLTSVILGSAAIVASISPGFASVVAERSVPHYGQESGLAEENAQYRLDALRSGTSVASKHYWGLGITSAAELEQQGIDPGFLVHSGPSTLLTFLGWPGLLAATLILVGLIIDSSRLSSRNRWLHPVFVGVLVMLVGNSFGAVGIVGQEYVMGVGALVVAFRFATAEGDQGV
jgi:hypothetical protein